MPIVKLETWILIEKMKQVISYPKNKKYKRELASLIKVRR